MGEEDLLKQLNVQRIDAKNALYDADANLHALRTKWDERQDDDPELAAEISEAWVARDEANRAHDAADQEYSAELTRQRVEYEEEQRN